jgi:hypothetical protein
MLRYRFSVFPKPSAVRRGDGFSLHVANLLFAEEVTHVWVDLARVEWDETSRCWNSAVTPILHNGTLELSFHRLDLNPGIYLVSRLRFSLDAIPNVSKVVDARPTANFPRTFIQVTDQPMQPVEPAKLAERLVLIEQGRDSVFLSGITADPANPGIGRFRGFAFVTRCLLRSRLRLGQIEVMPLRIGLQSIELSAIIQQVLAEFGSPVVETDDAWARASAEAFPVMVIHMPLIYARDRAQAVAAIVRHSRAVIDVLSPHRMSYGEPLAYVLESLDSPGRIWPMQAFGGYRGNMIGGFISGEDPKALRNDLWNVLADPMLQLFVSLYREAASEINIDFAYLRFWNLLEAIATRRVTNQNITTFDGQPITGPKGKCINTAGDSVARVYALIKTHFQPRGLKEDFFLSGLQIRDLWSVCRVWWGYRSATAHYGGFVPADSHQSRQGWYPLTSRAYTETTTSSVSRGLFTDRYFMALAMTARSVVIWEIANPPRADRVLHTTAPAQ